MPIQELLSAKSFIQQKSLQSFVCFGPGIINMHPRTLEEYFYESCIIPEGDDIDDEDFKIRVIYKIFEKSSYSSSEPLEVTGNVLFSTKRKRMLFLKKN